MANKVISKITINGSDYRIKCLEHVNEDGTVISGSTLDDYGILDAYTKDQVDRKLIEYLTESEAADLFLPKGNYLTKHQDISGKLDLLTSNLLKAVNSGITAAKVAAYDEALSSDADNITESTIIGWGFTKNEGTYVKPSTGIPKADLSTEVLNILTKASNGVSLTDLEGKADKSTTLAGYGIADAKILDRTITLGNLSITVATAEDLEGKQNVINDLDSIRSGVQSAFTALQPGSLKTINGESIIGNGNIVIQGGSGGGYTKPTDGIPKNDLSLSVQESLNKADSALQSTDLSTYETSDHALLTYLPKGNYLTSADVEGKIDSSEKGVANGVAPLGPNGKIPADLLPAMLADFTNDEINDLITFIYWAKNNKFGPWTENVIVNAPIYYGAASSAPTTEALIKEGTKLNIDSETDIDSVEINIPSGTKSLWLALPLNKLEVLTWVDSALKVDKQYITESSPILVDGINYILYHSDAVIKQSNGSVVKLDSIVTI